VKTFIVAILAAAVILSAQFASADSVVEDTPRETASELGGGTTTSHEDIQGGE